MRKLDSMIAGREIDIVRIDRRVLVRLDSLQRLIETHTVRRRGAA